MKSLRTVQENLQRTTVIAWRRSHEMLSEQSASETKGDATCEAMEALTKPVERQEPRRTSSRRLTRSRGM